MGADIRRPIQTAVGAIFGRDAIFLDLMTQDGPVCSFSGELNGNLCNAGESADKYIPFQIVFHGVRALHCWELDVYPRQAELVVASFYVLKNSAWVRSLCETCERDDTPRTLSHYVFGTYDYIYELVALRFEMTLGDARDKVAD